MEFEFTGEQKMLAAMTREFAVDRLAPVAAEHDRREHFAVETYRELGGLGLLGVNVAAAYGGSEAGAVAYSLAVTELSRECASTAVTVAVTNMVAEAIERFGDEEQRQRFLPPLTSGELVAGSFALSEAGAGSDAAALSTRARREGDDYVLNGEKMWVTSGAYSGVLILMAKTDPSAGGRGISAFLVTPNLPGFKVGASEDKLGMRASNTVSILLEDCVVPASRLLGREGEGLKIALAALDGGRIGVASQALGIGTAARDAAARYASERRQFGQPIASFDAIRGMLADMSTELEAARWLTLRAAWLKERGVKRYSREAAMAKLFASETANRVCGDAVQIHGGYGFTREFGVERNFRDARVTTIYEGTSQIQRIVIAREVLKQFGSSLPAG